MKESDIELMNWLRTIDTVENSIDPDEHTHQIAHPFVQQLDEKRAEKSATVDRERNVGDRFLAHVQRVVQVERNEDLRQIHHQSRDHVQTGHLVEDRESEPVLPLQVIGAIGEVDHRADVLVVVALDLYIVRPLSHEHMEQDREANAQPDQTNYDHPEMCCIVW